MNVGEEWNPSDTGCDTGQNQPPIDIAKTSPTSLPKIRADFSPTKPQIVHHEHVAGEINNGHTIQINYSEGDTLTVGDTNYELIQFHFHSPSEHTLHGKHYPMEMHFVHKSPAGTLAGRRGVHRARGAQYSLRSYLGDLPKQKGVESHFEHVHVDVDNFLPHSHTSYRYDGSLTTPPCSKGVKWIVMKSPIQLSKKQIQAFNAIIKANNRPVQPLHHRVAVTDAIAEDVVAR